MQAIAGLSRSLSRALVQGVVQRSQATEATHKPRPEAADAKLGTVTHVLFLRQKESYHLLFSV
jgi:hypothetical protein